MFPENPRIGILGAGALGAFYGARLFRAGHDVHFLMRSDWKHVRAHGFSIKSIEGDFQITPPVYADPESLGICDLVIIGLKSTDNGALPGLLGPVAGPDTVVLTLQNGLGNEEAIEAALGGRGGERILGGVAFLCSNRIGPGVIHHIDHGWVRMAQYRGAARERTHRVAQLFRSAGIRCEVYDSLMLARWEKLVWNVPFNGLGVAAGANTAAVLADEELLELVRGLMREVVDASAMADGVQIDPELPERMVANTRTMGEYRTSMQIDYEEGRPLEAEAILGEPLRRARGAGVPAARLQALYALVRRLEVARK